MTRIKALCPVCGEKEFVATDFDLQVCSHAPLSYYSFKCPECEETIKHPADDHIVSLLMSGGVIAHVWSIPAEALEPKLGPTLDYDDLLNFALELQEDDLVINLADVWVNY